jgi:RHS repeat-associated protein
VTDPNGVATTAAYDSLGRQLTAATDGKNPHIIYSYDWTAPKPVTWTYLWDQTLASTPAVSSGQAPSGTGWRQSVLVANGAGEDLFSATKLSDTRWIVSGWKERDSRGHVVVHGDPFYWDGADARDAQASEAQPVASGDQYAFRSQALEYDALGRLRKQTLPNQATKSIVYQAFGQTVTSSDLSPVTSQMDGFGRIIHTERTVAGMLERADATYDAADRLTLISLQGGRDKNGALLPGKAEHSFVYDTLGRLVGAHDPDIGQRDMSYDNRNFLVRHRNGAGDVLAFFYDDAGRLTARGPRNDFAAPVLTYTADARDYRYSYDTRATEAAGCSGQGYTQGRLAAVDEPIGGAPGVGRVSICYDSLGRQQGLWRSIGTKKAWQWTSLAASGLSLIEQADDAFKVFSDYDPAGRLVMLSDATSAGLKNKPIWSATPDSAAAQALDAAGRVMAETYGQNIVAQNYLRDALGLPSGIQVGRLGTTPKLLYQVSVNARTSYGAPTTVVDAIAGSIDHNATYAYDGAARLTNAIIGQGAAAWKFRFEYDGLQNMTGRTQEAPAGKGSLAIQSGTYRYGENGFGPRQLTSVAHDCDNLLNTYQYDGAGRLNKDAKKVLAYDGYDQLTSVTDNGAALVSHAYGYDGLRTYTKGSGNSEQYWFDSDDTLQPGGATRWHYVKVGDRLVARLSFTHPTTTPAFPPAGASVAWWPRIEARIPQYFVTTTAAAALLLLAWAAWRRRRPLWQTAPAVACSLTLVLATPGCDDGVDSRKHGLEDASARRYFHQGIAAGPTLITDGGGAVVDERRSEPFGTPIEGNLVLDPYNSLNKETNKDTGWSYHGARWMAPQTARWLTPDPPVKVPDKRFMGAPWSLHPYVYGNQSPTKYWDPDGLDGEDTAAYIGASENAKNEQASLAGQDLRFTVPKYANMFQGFDLSTDEGIQKWSSTLGKSGEAAATWLKSIQRDSVDLRWGTARERVYVASIISVFHEAQTGEINLSRLVLSGHHLIFDAKLFGDEQKGGGQLRYATLAKVAGMFPAAAAQVRDLMLSACNSLAGKEALGLRQLFPGLRSVWGYVGTSPATPEGGGHATAAEHIKRWLSATEDGRSAISSAATKGLRNVETLSGSAIYGLRE